MTKQLTFKTENNYESYSIITTLSLTHLLRLSIEFDKAKKMNTKKTITLTIGIIILNVLIGHFFAPNGIMFTPIVLLSISSIIWFGNNNLTLIQKSIFLAALISFHDIGIKLFSGGRHDSQGLGWTHAMLLIGLIPTFVILIGGIVKDKNEIRKNKWIAFLLFPIIISIHFYLFLDLGIGRYYWYNWNG